MKSFNHNDYRNIVIRCTTQEQYDTVVSITGVDFENNYWPEYKEESCISPCDVSYCSRKYYEDHGWKSISFEEFMKPYLEEINNTYDIF